MVEQSLYERAGGADGVRLLAEAFYARVFADPVMLPLFHDLNEDHAGRMALWLGEFFGGPAEHTRQRGGNMTMFAVHHMLNISDAQRQHWIAHMLAACEEVSLPDDVMALFEPHIHFGARAAQNSSRSFRSRFG